MEVSEVYNLTANQLSAGITLCTTKINKFKNSPTLQKKWMAQKKAFENAHKRLTAVINYLSGHDKDGNECATSGNPSLLAEFNVGGNALNVLSLAEIDRLMSSTTGVDPSKYDKINGTVGTDGKMIGVDYKDTSDIESVVVKRDIFQTFGDLGRNILDGKGKSAGLAGTLLGVGVSEIAARGVTGFLAKKGIMESGMGLFGLIGEGWSQLPALWPIVQNGFSAIWGFSPLAVCTVGAFAAIKIIPSIKRFIDKSRKSIKELNSEKILAEELAKKAPAPTSAP